MLHILLKWFTTNVIIQIIFVLDQCLLFLRGILLHRSIASYPAHNFCVWYCVSILFTSRVYVLDAEPSKNNMFQTASDT